MKGQLQCPQSFRVKQHQDPREEVCSRKSIVKYRRGEETRKGTDCLHTLTMTLLFCETAMGGGWTQMRKLDTGGALRRANALWNEEELLQRCPRASPSQKR